MDTSAHSAPPLTPGMLPGRRGLTDGPRGRAVRQVPGRRDPVGATSHGRPRRGAGGEDPAAAATTTGTVRAGRACLGGPRVPSAPAVGVQRRSCQRTARRREHDRPAGAAASSSVVLGEVVRGCAVGRDRSGSAHGPGPDEHRATTGRPARRRRREVVPGTGAAATAQEDSSCRGGKRDASVAAAVEVGVPGVAALPTGPAVAATAATGVLVIGRRVAVGAAAAGIGRGAARGVAAGVAVARRRAQRGPSDALAPCCRWPRWSRS